MLTKDNFRSFIVDCLGLEYKEGYYRSSTSITTGATVIFELEENSNVSFFVNVHIGGRKIDIFLQCEFDADEYDLEDYRLDSGAVRDLFFDNIEHFKLMTP